MEITFKITDKERLELMKALDEKNQKSVEDWQQKQEAKEKSINGLLIRVGEKENSVSRVTLDGTLEGYYDALGCSTIDIPARRIGSRQYAIVCDDDALSKSPVIPSCISAREHTSAIFGSAFICNFGENGELASLTDEDVRRISRCIKVVLLHRRGEKGADVFEVRSCVTNMGY